MFFKSKSIGESPSSRPLPQCIDTVQKNPGTTMLVISLALIGSGIVMLLLPGQHCASDDPTDDEKEETPPLAGPNCSHDAIGFVLLFVGVMMMMLSCMYLKARVRQTVSDVTERIQKKMPVEVSALFNPLLVGPGNGDL